MTFAEEFSVVGESSPEEESSGKGTKVESPGEGGTSPGEDRISPGEGGTPSGDGRAPSDEDKDVLVTDVAASSTVGAPGITSGGPFGVKCPFNEVTYSVVGRREGEGGSCKRGDCADGCETAVDRGCGRDVAGSPEAPNTSSHPKPSSTLPSIGKLSTGGKALVIGFGLNSTLDID